MEHSSIATTQRYDKRNPDPGNCTLRGDVQEFSVLFAEFLQDFSGYNGEFLHFPVRMLSILFLASFGVAMTP